LQDIGLAVVSQEVTKPSPRLVLSAGLPQTTHRMPTGVQRVNEQSTAMHARLAHSNFL